MEPVGQLARRSVHDVMWEISFVLLEPVVKTTLGTAIASGPARTVFPPDMRYIYPGAMLLVVSPEVALGGNIVREVVTVDQLTADGTGFTAAFSLDHAATDLLRAATFPTGYPEKQLFTQAEILSYIADCQNEFLLRTRPVFSTALLELEVGNRMLDQPEDAIRVEHVAIDEYHLFDASQRDLDLDDPGWIGKRGRPQHWYQDELGVAQLGFDRVADKRYYLDTWYAQRANANLTLDEDLLVPRIFAYAVKFGALAHVFEKDGELRQPALAKYCDRRFDFTVKLADRFLRAVGHKPENAPAVKYNPLQVEG